MTMRIYVPRDAAAVAVGANEVALAFAQAAAAMLDARVRDDGDRLVIEPLPASQK